MFLYFPHLHLVSDLPPSAPPMLRTLIILHWVGMSARMKGDAGFLQSLNVGKVSKGFSKENRSFQGGGRLRTLSSFVSNKEKGHSESKLIKMEGNCQTIDNCSERAVVTPTDCHFRGTCRPTTNQGH